MQTTKLLATATVALFGLQAMCQEVFINEIHYDNSGTDAGEAIEIAGPEGTNLSGWSVVLYNGSVKKAYNTHTFSETLLDSESGGYGFAEIRYQVNGIQNGAPDGIALVDTDGTVVQFLSYEGSFTAIDGPASGFESEDIGVAESGSTESGQSLQLSGTGFQYGDFSWQSAANETFGSVNNEQIFENTAAPAVAINEIRIDQPSADNDEYVELKGPAGFALDGLTYLVIGDGPSALKSGVVEAVVDLNGLAIQDDGILLIAEYTYSLGTADATRSLNFENSDNVTHLLVSNFTGSNGDDLDPDDDGMLDIIPWDKIVDGVALVESFSSGELIYSEATIGPDGSYVPGQVFKNCNGDWEIGTFDPSASQETPGTENCNNNGGGDDIELVFIHDVQGNGSESPFVGQTVTIEGVVVADFQEEDELKGYFVQEEDSDVDNNVNTSEGVFVYDPGKNLDVAQSAKVRITGTVSEYHGLTEITVSDAVIIAAETELPAATPITLPVASMNEFEKFEGMYITQGQPLYVTETYNLGRYGELLLTGAERLMAPTQIASPGAPAIAVQKENDLNAIILDDASTVQNPDPVPYPHGGLSAFNTVRCGYQVDTIFGVLGYGYNAYRIHPVAAPVFFSEYNPRTDAPAETGGDLKVASFNVLNYFNGDGLGGGFPTSRGANTYSEFIRQRDKIVSAMTAIGADIFGLMEIENDGYGSLSAIQDLVNGLNTNGSAVYAAVTPSIQQIGTDEIAVGLIYNTATVSLSGPAQILDSGIDPRFDDTKNRPSLAQTFIDGNSGEKFTVVVNHLKSKGSSCESIGDPDTGDGQGNCNQTRTSAAHALVDWLQTDSTNAGNSNTIIIGDLNAYAQEDPVSAIKAGGYTNALEELEGTDAYSYVFDGMHGTLDHALVNNAMLANVTGIATWNINSVEPKVLDYNTEYKSAEQINVFYAPDAFRSSDHDPVIIGLSFENRLRVTGFNLIDVQNNIINLELETGATIESSVQINAVQAQIDSTFTMARFQVKRSRTQEGLDNAQEITVYGGYYGRCFFWYPAGYYHSVTATPIAYRNGQMIDGRSKTVEFYLTGTANSLKSGNTALLAKDSEAVCSPSVFPNPFTDKLTVTGTEAISIFNASGTVVYSAILSCKRAVLDLSFLPQGTYTAVLRTAVGDDVIQLLKR